MTEPQAQPATPTPPPSAASPPGQLKPSQEALVFCLFNLPAAILLLAGVVAVVLWIRGVWWIGDVWKIEGRGFLTLIISRGGTIEYCPHYIPSFYGDGYATCPPEPTRWLPRFVWRPDGAIQTLVLPYWFLILACWTLAWLLRPRGDLACFWRREVTQANLRQNPDPGLCPHCGYDLRASKDACPECGTPIPPDARRVRPTS